MNFIEQEIEDFKEMKEEAKQKQRNMKDNNGKGVSSGRKQWLNKQIKQNEEKMKKLKQKLQETEKEKVKQ